MGNDAATIAETLPLGSAELEAAEGRPTIAGYEITGRVGQGGMGVVWEAIELRFDRKVALKVHGPRAEGSDLWSEALIAARVGDPSIVRVLDVGLTLDDRPYYAMELVEGTELAAIVREGPLPPRRAVAIAADIARAAAAAHDHGVIHRDLKPQNVVIDPTGRARILDFGIALRVSDGGAEPEGLTGSPAYMAPEQVLGQAITPRTDIFAVGVILYEMLTGERPFRGDSTTQLLEAVVSAVPDKPSAKNPAVHEDLDAVVMRCLAKAPEDRYPSARALFETLHAIAEGRPVEADDGSMRPYARKPTIRPAGDKPKRDEARKHLAWKWTLASSPSALWPYIANTDRFNKAVGLQPVAFSDEPLPQGGAERTGELRILGMPIRWREYPFEWVKDREHSVFRWYRAGPLAALWNKVTLTPLADGGTELAHEIWLTPRNVIGQVAAFVEIERKLGPAIDKFYRHLDGILASGRGEDPFDPPHSATPEQIAMVERAARELVQHGFDNATVQLLANHLLTTPDAALGSIRPYELADEWGLPRPEVLDLFLHAAHAGLLEPAWDVVCPKCMLAHESVHALAHVTRVGTCAACASSFERDLRDSVELAFSVTPALRPIERATYCAGAPALRPHVLAQQILDPGETRVVTVELPRGSYRIAGTIAKTTWPLVASAVGYESEVHMKATTERVEGRPDIVRAGRVTFVLENATEFEETIRIEVPGAREDGVSAATAMTHPSFRDLFAEQLLAHGEHVRVSHLSFLFVAVRSRVTLFEELGDAAACAELSTLDRLVRDVACENEGTVVPSSLDLLVVAFAEPTKATRAGLELRRRVDASPLARPVALALHDGRCIALTREGKQEFFGETLHRGEALLDDCPEGGLILSASFGSDRAVAIAVHASGMRVAVAKSSSSIYAGRRVMLLTRGRPGTSA